MKRVALLLVIVLAMCLVASTGHAQFEKGKSFLGPRLGIGAHGSGVVVGGGYEYGVTDVIGIGGLVDYYTWSTTGWGIWGGKYTYVIFGAQGNYHFGKALKWDAKIDPFAGLVLGYERVSWSWDRNPGHIFWEPSASGIILGGQIGIRYFVSPNLALYGQTGFGITYLKVGVDFKF
ncbi:MAG: hypothetical protein NTW97_11040 [Candidatus Krumholzibacteria bacterium]|nr:hypothetical protein [Candidatus Krumholzibacteria bacterium]